MAEALRLVPLSTSDCEPWLAHRGAFARNWARANGFEGKAGTALLLPDAAGQGEVLLCGLGDGPSLYGLAHLAALSLDRPLALEEEAWRDPETARMALGYRLAAYRFDRYTSRPAAPRLRWPNGEPADGLGAIAHAVCRVRDLVNTPAEDLGPAELADAVLDLASECGARCEVLVGEELLERNFPAVHVVGRAAAAAPRFVDLTWGDPARPTLVLVGKGVCFDSGGLDIKPASGMLLMKKDMGGAAHALALAELVMKRELPVHLKLLIPAVENAIAGNAYRPGDIVPTRAGQRVEVGNTDAEGRVILSDALAYGSEFAPDLMIDFATLTGAARVALGPDLPPYFTDDEDLAGQWEAASAAVADPVWRMPLFAGYDEAIDTPLADVSNTGSLGMGGAITAALFLRRFVGPAIPWTHLDVYAWNPSDRPGRPRGGEAHALRAAWELLERRYR